MSALEYVHVYVSQCIVSNVINFNSILLYVNALLVYYKYVDLNSNFIYFLSML